MRNVRESPAEAALHGLADSVLTVDEGGRISFANAAAEALLGASANRILGESLRAFFPEDCVVFSLLARARLERSGLRENDARLRLRGERTAHRARLTVAPLEVGAAGCSPPGRQFLVVMSPLSQAETLRDHMAHTRLAESLGGALALLNHEIRNPLAALRGALQLLEGALEGKERELGGIMIESCDRITALLSEWEVLASCAPLSPSAVNIHEAMEHVLREAKRTFAQRVVFEEIYDPSLPAVAGSRGLLVQAFLNLVRNAAEAARESAPRIRVTTRFRHALVMRLPGEAGYGRPPLPVEVEVADNGAGVDPLMRDTLFAPFTSSKGCGRGLGLAVVAKVMADHGGVIEVGERVDGSGAPWTAFSLFLPSFRPESP